MTDNTQPEAGSTHIIRYALEMGLLWIDGDGRDKVREALDALDTLEAQLASAGFTAADMATAAAQRFRDGAASLAAAEAIPKALPTGWSLADHGDEISLEGPSGERWRYRAASGTGTDSDFIYRFLHASISANAESEPVYQARYQKGFWQDSSRERCEYLQNPENTCAEDWETRILYTRPPTSAEGVEHG